MLANTHYMQLWLTGFLHTKFRKDFGEDKFQKKSYGEKSVQYIYLRGISQIGKGTYLFMLVNYE